MRNLIFILLAFLAVFTFMRTIDSAEAQVAERSAIISTSEISVEINR